MADEPRFLRGADGVRLAVHSAGDPQAPPIVLLHGWSASAAAWEHQLADTALCARHRLIAVDLRGHGASDTPERGYDDPAVWADDLAAVLAHAGRPPVLVGWSYGGLVIADYLRQRGSAGVAGIVFVGAITEIGRTNPGGRIGSAWQGVLRPALSEDPEQAIPAITTLVSRMTQEPLPGHVVQRLVGDILRVPPSVRAALFRREVASGDVLAAIDVPVLVAHGDRDTVVEPDVAEYTAGKISGASARWFPGVGHLPFTERVAEFNNALLEFAGTVDH